MSLIDWWKNWREKTELTRRSLEISEDQALIANHVPELEGMDDVSGMAYVLKQIDKWNSVCSPEQAAVFASRLIASNESWKAEGLTMPFWGNLWVLRTYQAELGMAAPEVSPPHMD